MLMSENTSNLFSALIKAREDIETVIKDKAGFGYNYATLDNVINMLKGVLPKHDLGYSQFPETIDGKDGVTTIVIHKSGEYMSARYEMDATPMKGTNITQQKGASITYTRRYALCSIFGIPTEEDTDGRVAGDSTFKPMTEQQKATLLGLGVDFNKVLPYLKLQSADEISFEQAEALIKAKKLKDSQNA